MFTGLLCRSVAERNRQYASFADTQLAVRTASTAVVQDCAVPPALHVPWDRFVLPRCLPARGSPPCDVVGTVTKLSTTKTTSTVWMTVRPIDAAEHVKIVARGRNVSFFRPNCEILSHHLQVFVWPCFSYVL